MAEKTRSSSHEMILALVETAFLIALAYILNMFKLFRMPNGGSVHPAAMLPLVLIGLRHGPKWGFLGCTVYGILDFMLDGGFAINIWSILLDYVVAYGVLGVAGFYKGKSWGIWAAIPTAIFARFCCLFISGMTIWVDYTSMTFAEAAVYSAGYNAGYLAAEMGLMFVLAFALRVVLPKYINPKK